MYILSKIFFIYPCPGSPITTNLHNLTFRKKRDCEDDSILSPPLSFDACVTYTERSVRARNKIFLFAPALIQRSHNTGERTDTFFLQVFAIQYYGECWSGNEGEKTYSEYGWSRNCWQGVGGSHTNFVYEFVDGKKVRTYHCPSIKESKLNDLKHRSILSFQNP